MRDIVNIYNVALGINNKVDHASLKWENGITELAQAENVRITDSGKIETLPRWVQVSDLEVHSVYTDESIVLFGDTLGDIYTLDQQGAPVKIGQNLDGSPIQFQKFGDKIFMMTNTNALYWDGVQFNPWTLRRNADAMQDIELSGPPQGQLLSKYRDRIIVCQGETAIFSQSLNPFAFNLADDFISINEPITFSHEFEDELILGSMFRTVAVANPTTEPSIRVLIQAGAFHHTAVEMHLPEILRSLVFRTTQGVFAFNTQRLLFSLSPSFVFPNDTEVYAAVIPNTNFYYLTGG